MCYVQCEILGSTGGTAANINMTAGLNSLLACCAQAVLKPCGHLKSQLGRQLAAPPCAPGSAGLSFKAPGWQAVQALASCGIARHSPAVTVSASAGQHSVVHQLCPLQLAVQPPLQLVPS